LTPDELDIAVRTAAFAYLVQQRTFHGDLLSRALISRGFPFGNQTVKLMGPQGIFKPAILDQMPLSITTVPEVPGKPRPYEVRAQMDSSLTDIEAKTRRTETTLACVGRCKSRCH